MLIIDSYIRKNILGAIFIVLLVIVGLDMVASFISELEDLKAEYQIVQALAYVLVMVPGKINEFLSVSILIGCLIGLGALASSSELLVMRAAGVSPRRLVYAVLKPVMVLAFLGLVLTQWIVPPIEQWGQAKKTSERSNSGMLKTKGGVWHREGNEYIHIKTVTLDGQLHDIQRFRFDNNNKMISAHNFKKADYEDEYWKVQGAFSTALKETSTDIFHFDELHWFSGLTPKNLSTAVIKPDQLSISTLYQYVRYFKKQELDASSYQVSFWKKIFQPFVTIAMVLIAIYFIFGPLRTSTAGFRIVIGVFIGIGFQQLQQLAAYGSLVYQIEPFVAVFVPIIFAMFVALFLIRRIQ